MKRIFSAVLIFVLILASLTACGEEEGVYGVLNGLIEKTEGFVLTVNTVTGGESLTDTYRVSYTDKGYTVAYSYELLNEIDLENPTDEYKSVKRGEAAVEDGRVVSHTGDEPNGVPGKLALSFKESVFANAAATDTSFTADITNAEAFIGKAVNATGMTVAVKYTAEALEEILISYQTAQSNVTITYTFSA